MLRGLSAILFALSLALPGSIHANEVSPLVEPAWLHAWLQDPTLRIVDMATDPWSYQVGHIPGAVYLNIRELMPPAPPAGSRTLSAEEASRLFGHKKVSILNGGLPAWRRDGFPLASEPLKVTPTTYRSTLQSDRQASAEWILARLNDPRVALVDARSPGEYRGVELLARRGGHIPGAVNIEWLQHLRRDGTFKPVEELRALYVARGVTPDKTVVPYCQTFHRSAHTYFVLRLLGYPRVAGYDRSWAEWGNRDDLPVAR